MLMVLSALLLFIATMSPAVADADEPQFHLDFSSAQPGSTITISQGDPCPVSPTLQYAVASFTDAANTTTQLGYVSTGGSGANDGTWNGEVSYQIPFDAPQGLGHFDVYCRYFDDNSQEVRALDYAPQPFTVQGAVPTFTTSSPQYSANGTVHITSAVPCPDGTASVNVAIRNSQEFVYLPGTGTVDQNTGSWYADVYLPETVYSMGMYRDLPIGTYQLSAVCLGTSLAPRLDYVMGSVEVTAYVPPPRDKYVAMGDSFSSGEGVEPFEYGTDTPDFDMCHRSSLAYPRLVAQQFDLDLQNGFVACSGSLISDILSDQSANNVQNHEDAQVNHLGTDTKTVTLTIGGNDVGFKDYAIACTEKLCGPGTFDYDYIMDAINNPDFFLNLTAMYESILTHAPNAQVYVSGYPFLAAEDSDVCGQVDLTGAWAVQDQLNAVINDAVDDVEASIPTTRLHYVDPNRSGSPFIGTYLCNGGMSDFNGLDLLHPEYSFHPNADGQQDFKSVFADSIS